MTGKTAFFAIFLIFPLSPAASGGGWAWRESASPHFAVSHEMAWLPGGLQLGLERMHSRLRMDLAMFSPWMSRERIKLYIYKDADSYRGGQFKPPAWSNGIALYQQKVVAVYDQPDRKKLMEVVSHETTHLLFESYWGEAAKTPPAWLNEGLAMMEENDSHGHPERSDWYKAMVYMLDKDSIPMSKFVSISPNRDLGDNQKAVQVWYVQSYAAVTFLFRGHSRLQFKSFCEKLREGADLKHSLWYVYRYHSVEQFEKAWKAWLRDPSRRARLAEGAAGRTQEWGSDFRPMMDFKLLNAR